MRNVAPFADAETALSGIVETLLGSSWTGDVQWFYKTECSVGYQKTRWEVKSDLLVQG